MFSKLIATESDQHIKDEKQLRTVLFVLGFFELFLCVFHCFSYIVLNESDDKAR